ncbi:Ig-like domain-containing protein [Anaerosacchariphilus polymeriproducens]|uniref:BIG2 domain-containing protein n=1 Tax=Anaerosacchariphilus polymeriproducens TaxID=1812858 RepID=A0A371ATL5_9FIRM|nr:Ig-like domain-containing protein [Anaerosacchariphilus polymeriproducens]RDU22924.1 hypothetical protein DWV06_11150 [Anaerosacchariphilus polymeriproducens]
MKHKKLIAIILGLIIGLEPASYVFASNSSVKDSMKESSIVIQSQDSRSNKNTFIKPALTLNRKALTVYLKNPITLKATTKPTSKIKWKSSNKKIAVVSTNGKITGKKTGTVTITASANGLKKTCKVKIKKPTLSINSNSINVIDGYNYQFNAKTKPAKTSSKIIWSTSNKKIASISSKGIITGNKPGTATITAKFCGIKKTCKVNVEKNIFKLNKTSKTLLAGDTFTLNMPGTSLDVDYKISQSSEGHVVILDQKNNSCSVTALNAGTATITATTYPIRNGKKVTCTSSCTLKILASGISPQQSSCAVGSSKQFTLINGEKLGTAIEDIKWTSSNSDVVTIDSTSGIATAKKTGTANITAVVTYANNTSTQFTGVIKVSSPSLSSYKYTLALHSSYKLKLTGTNNFSDIKLSSSSPDVATISSDGMITTYKAGTTTITAIVDEKKLDFLLTVSNPYLKTNYKALTKGKTFTIKLNGKNKLSKVKFSSDNKSVATVSKSGVVKAKNYGNANIIITVDGKELKYFVSVVSKTALNATKKAKSIIDSSIYSQTYRMKQGYYDCSSLVFRAYNKNTVLLGESFEWAPNAAKQAKYLENHGKVLSYKWINNTHLLPGDLIFYGNKNNGRYKGIYHVAMYYGNKLCVEKPLRTYTYNKRNIVMIARPIK